MLLTDRQVAETIGKSPAWVREKLLRSGDLPFVRFGASYRVRGADFEAFLERKIEEARRPQLVELPAYRSRRTARL